MRAHRIREGWQRPISAVGVPEGPLGVRRSKGADLHRLRRHHQLLCAHSLPAQRGEHQAVVEVRVRTVAGEEHTVVANRFWTLGHVKKALQSAMDVPAGEQRLVHGVTVLMDDSECLCAFVDDDGEAGEGAASESAAAHEEGEQGPPPDEAAKGGIRSVELTLVRRTSQQALWLNRVGHHGMMLYDVPEELKADRELVLTAVRQKEEAFQFAAAALQADRHFVLDAVRLNAAVLPYISAALRGDREIVLAAVRRRGELLSCLSSEFRADQEVVMSAVKQHGLAFRYAAESLRADKNLVIASVEQNAGALAYAAEALRSDREVLSAALRSKDYPHATLAREDRLVDEAAIQDNWLVL